MENFENSIGLQIWVPSQNIECDYISRVASYDDKTVTFILQSGMTVQVPHDNGYIDEETVTIK